MRYLRDKWIKSSTTWIYVIILLVACQAGDGPVPAPAPVTPKPTKPIPPPRIPCTPTPPANSSAKKILFVGNSLTYFNDLPSLVLAIAVDHSKVIEVESLTFPNYALEDHWNDGCIQVLIASGYYDFVIMQQGPSSQEEGRTSLLEYGVLVQALCRKADTKLAFYMVWPSRANYHTFQGVIDNYTQAAQTTGAILCPVGLVWKEHFDQTNDFSYYGPDNFHPSLAGSQVAATVIYSSLFP